MKVAIVTLALMIGVVVLFLFADILNSWLDGGKVALIFLLVSIPISLALFAFLSHRQSEQLKTEEKEK